MTEGVYPFKVGSFECAVVSDGTAMLLPKAAKILFANAPEAELVAALQAHGIVGYDIPYRMNCLYVQTDSHQVLVDTGLGGGVHPALGQLIANLDTIGVIPADIDTLIITHGHGDHIGGLTDSTGKLIFPNARYFMRKPEWEFWTAEESLAKMDDFASGFARTNSSNVRRILRRLPYIITLRFQGWGKLGEQGRVIAGRSFDAHLLPRRIQREQV